MALTGWDFTKSTGFYIPASDVDTDLADVLVRVPLNSTDHSAVFDEVGSDYLKIAIELGDTGEQTFAEVEYWDDTGEEAVLHVYIPAVSSSTNTEFRLYYDSTHDDNDEYDLVYSATYTEYDDFVGTDGDALDPRKWAVLANPSGVSINSNKLRFNTSTQTDIAMRRNFAAGGVGGRLELTLDTSACPETDSWAIKILLSNSDGTIHAGLNWYYGGGDHRVGNTWNNEGSYFSDGNAVRTLGVSAAVQLRFSISTSLDRMYMYYWTGSAWSEVTTAVDIDFATFDLYNWMILAIPYGASPTMDVTIDDVSMTAMYGMTGFIGAPTDLPAQIACGDDLIYHMNQSPAGGSGCILDSCFNENTGTPAGSMTSGDLVAAESGLCLDLDGTDDVITSDSNLGITGSTNRTIFVLFNQDAAKANACLFDTGTRTATGNALGVDAGTAGTAAKVEGYNISATFSADMSTSGWNTLAIVLDGTTMDDVKLYLNGSEATRTALTDGTINTVDAPLYVGSRLDGSNFFNGEIADIRVIEGAMSADWIEVADLAVRESLLESTGSPTVLEVALPVFDVEMYTGSDLEVALPVFDVEMTGTNGSDRIMDMEFAFPVFDVEMEGDARKNDLNVSLPVFGFEAYSGAALNIALPVFDFEGTVKRGPSLSADIAFPVFGVEMVGDADYVSAINISFPMFGVEAVASYRPYTALDMEFPVFGFEGVVSAKGVGGDTLDCAFPCFDINGQISNSASLTFADLRYVRGRV